MNKTFLSLITQLCFFCCISNFAYGTDTSPEPDSTVCLEIEGKVSNADQNDTPCKIQIIVDNLVVDSIILKNGKRKFNYLFNRNLHYTNRIIKEGFQSKSICVHTNMPLNNGLVYEFYFETTMFFTKPDAVEQAPIATIYFNARKNCFYYTRSNPYVPGKANCINASSAVINFS